jgi:hypothetical protein
VSVHAAGMASAMGGTIFDDAPATTKWRDEMLAAAQSIGAKYAGDGPYRTSEVLADVDRWWKIATQFANEAKDVSSMSPANAKRAMDNAVNLLEARAELKLRVPQALSVTGDEARHYAGLMVAPIEWLVDVGDPVLRKVEEPASWIKRALWLGTAVVGVWSITRLLETGTTAKREIFGTKPLFAPRGLVKNPPAWAADPDLWETARIAVEENGPYENEEHVKIHVYKQLGGRVS